MPKTKAPFKKPASVDLMDKLDQFAGAVNETQAESRPLYPWEEPRVRADIIKGMGVPLSEPHLLKLRFIAENTKWSQRKFCQAKLEKAIDRETRAIIRALNDSKPYWTEPD